MPATAVPVLQLPGQKAERCGRASALGTRGAQGAGGPARHAAIFHAQSDCTRAALAVCVCGQPRLRAHTLHLCVPGVSARARAFHLPVGKVDACLGPPGIRHAVRAVVGTRGCSQANGLLPFSSLVQNFWAKKRNVLRSSPKGVSGAQICDMFIRAIYRMGLFPAYINSPAPGGTATERRDPTAPLTASPGCWQQPGCSGTELDSQGFAVFALSCIGLVLF